MQTWHCIADLQVLHWHQRKSGGELKSVDKCGELKGNPRKYKEQNLRWLNCSVMTWNLHQIDFSSLFGVAHGGRSNYHSVLHLINKEGIPWAGLAVRRLNKRKLWPVVDQVLHWHRKKTPWRWLGMCWQLWRAKMQSKKMQKWHCAADQVLHWQRRNGGDLKLMTNDLESFRATQENTRLTFQEVLSHDLKFALDWFFTSIRCGRRGTVKFSPVLNLRFIIKSLLWTTKACVRRSEMTTVLAVIGSRELCSSQRLY